MGSKNRQSLSEIRCVAIDVRDPRERCELDRDHFFYAKQGYPDWRMFDKGYYQAISKIRPDWEGFIKTLQDNKDDESSAKALAAKYAIPEADAKKLLELTIEKIALLGDKCAEEKPKREVTESINSKKVLNGKISRRSNPNSGQ